jgi:Glycosyl hydrolases family 35
VENVPVKHTFVIGENEFLLDGRSFVIRCDEVHFTRVPPKYWTHRLQHVQGHVLEYGLRLPLLKFSRVGTGQEAGQRPVVLNSLVYGHRSAVSLNIPFYDAELGDEDAVGAILDKETLTW